MRGSRPLSPESPYVDIAWFDARVGLADGLEDLVAGREEVDEHGLLSCRIHDLLGEHEVSDVTLVGVW